MVCFNVYDVPPIDVGFKMLVHKHDGQQLLFNLSISGFCLPSWYTQLSLSTRGPHMCLHQRVERNWSHFGISYHRRSFAADQTCILRRPSHASPRIHPSSWRDMRTSRNGRHPFDSISHVNWMLSSMPFRWINSSSTPSSLFFYTPVFVCVLSLHWRRRLNRLRNVCFYHKAFWLV